MRLVWRSTERGHDNVRPVRKQVGFALVPNTWILGVRAVSHLPRKMEPHFHIVSTDDVTELLLGAVSHAVEIVQFSARRAEQAGRREQRHTLFEETRFRLVRVFYFEKLADSLQLRPVVTKPALRDPGAP